MYKVVAERYDKPVIGTVRWRARGVSTGRAEATGKRRQITITGKTKRV